MRIDKSRGPVKAQYIVSRASRGWQASTSVLALALAGGLAMPAPAYADDWIGAISNDWFNAGNWSAGVPTGAGTAVVVNTKTPNPTLLNGGVATVGNVTISTGADAALVVSGGGKLNGSNDGIIGDVLSFTGTVTVTGAGSEWNSAGNLLVGLHGTGTLMVSNGGAVSSATGLIGTQSSSTSSATVTGVGSTWTNSGDLTVGHSGAGTLTIANGGTVSDFIGTLGAQVGSNGTVKVDGVGSAWTNGSSVIIGRLGTGALTVSNGASVGGGEGVLGAANGSLGTVLVDGAGSTWTNSGELFVGQSGTGTLAISNGGVVSDTSGFIGNSLGAVGSAAVDGVGSGWTNSAHLVVGVSGTGTLAISNGGAVSVGVDGTLGFYSGSIGTATVIGAGSTWTNSGDLTVGRGGTGTLVIGGGGAVSNINGFVGALAGSAGTATVDGASSTWTNTGSLTVGGSGIGTLTIANGGAVNNFAGYVGFSAGSTGTVAVDGVGSTWTNSSGLSIGGWGTGALTIRNGGTVSSVGINAVGEIFGSTGSVVVDGTGSTWNGNGFISVGGGGRGTLSISNGGAVSDVQGTLGDQAGAVGTATVTGAGSKWTNSDVLYVGYNGEGTLTIADKGTVGATNGVVIAAGSGSKGTLNIGGAEGVAATAAGILDTPVVKFSSGTGKLNFNHTGSNYQFNAEISGPGTINQIAGTTVLTGNSSLYTGVTNVTGGRLLVNGTLANSLVTASGGGILGGAGIVGGVAVQSGGIIAPGNSIGTLNINGNLTQAAGSTYQVELTSTGSSDLIKATGTATIANGATLNVVKLDAAPYVVGAHYTVLQADGGVSGTYTLTGNTTLSAFIGLIANYDPTHVYLDVTQTKSFAAAGLTPNQIATGAGVESLGNGNPIYTAVIMLPTDAVAQYAFDQLSGEIHASARTALIEDSRFLRNAVNDRIRAAFDSVGAANGTVVTYDDGKPRAVAATIDGLAVWGQGFGSWGHTDGDGNAARLNRSTGGFFVGADAPVFDIWRFGVVAGYSHTNFNARDRHSSGSSDNYHLGLYGGSQWGNIAFRSGLAYTWHDIDTARTIAFPGFSDSARSGYDAGTFQAFGELGYKVQAGAVQFEPFVNLAYVSLHTDGLREAGGAAALTGTGTTTGTAFTTLGLRAATSFTLGGAAATARGMVGWRHAFGDTTPLATMAFASGGNSFSTVGVPITRDAAVVEAGLDFALSPTAALGITYGGQFGSGLSDQSVKANLSVKF